MDRHFDSINEAIMYLGNENNPVRVYWASNARLPFFKADQMCDLLGYVGTNEALGRSLPYGTVAMNETTRKLYISTLGVIHMIMHSKMPKAKEVREWFVNGIFTQLWMNEGFIKALNISSFQTPEWDHGEEAFTIYDPTSHTNTIV